MSRSGKRKERRRRKKKKKRKRKKKKKKTHKDDDEEEEKEGGGRGQFREEVERRNPKRDTSQSGYTRQGLQSLVLK